MPAAQKRAAMLRGNPDRFPVAGKSAAKRSAIVGGKSRKAMARKATTRRTPARKPAAQYFVTSPYRQKGYKVTVNKKGNPEFVMVPYKHYLRLIGADKSDDQLAAEALARDEETFPGDMIEKLLEGENPIKVYRKHRGLTQAQLAEQVDIAPMYLSQIERGQRQGSTKLLVALARALRVDLDDLVQI